MDIKEKDRNVKKRITLLIFLVLGLVARTTFGAFC